MSFILDALKKSENERQRHHGPSMAEIPYGRRRTGQPVWMTVIIALLLVNLGILMFVLWRRESPSPGETAPNTAAAPPAAAREAAASATPSSTAKPITSALPAPPLSNDARTADVRPLSAEVLADPPADAATEKSLDAPLEGGPKLVRKIGEPETAASGSSTDSSATNNAPTLDALGGAQAMGLPALHLDIHVYSAKPAERFVFINMRKYAEGQTLTEGPTLQRIGNDGVILEYHGQRFALPRQ